MGTLPPDFMFQFGAPGALYHQPAVSSGSHLGRYEKSPPTVERTFAVSITTGANQPPLSQDITLHLRQQPKEALVTTEGKEKGESAPLLIPLPCFASLCTDPPPPARKPVDPPPIIQLTVGHNADPQQ